MFQVSTDIMNMDMHMLHAVFLFVVFGSCSLDVQYLYIYMYTGIYIYSILFFIYFMISSYHIVNIWCSCSIHNIYIYVIICAPICGT